MADAVNIHEAKTHFSKLISRVQSGEEVTISKAGKPVAKLVPVKEKKPAPRVPGIDKGKIWIAPGAFDPMTDEELAEFMGGDSLKR